MFANERQDNSIEGIVGNVFQSFAFVWFLKKAKILNTDRITPEALTALTLLVAESDPKDKEQIVGLVMMLIGK